MTAAPSPLLGNAEERIELLVAVLVMKDGQGIKARRNAFEVYLAGASLHRALQSQRIALAVWKMCMIARQAGMDGAARVPEPREVEFNRGTWRADRHEWHRKKQGCKSAHHTAVYQPQFRLAKPLAR